MEGYNALELLKIAKGVEEEGYRFYTEAAARFDEEHIKKTFEYLAVEEAEHVLVFERLYQKVAESKKEQEVQLEDEAVTQYLKAISDTAIFNTNGLTNYKVSQVHTVKDALLIGLQAEKDAILFYETMLKNTSDPSLQKVLQRLIKEEVKHLYHFNMLIQELG
ncbi:MAG: ferritin family protein [Thermotaleaceae bacterium]